jgi:N,N'-diacetyllegionaminate synthase
MDRVYIIAEIGNNHNGSVDKAIELIDMAAAAGADAVKFQSFSGLDIVAPNVRADAYPGWNVQEYEFWYQFLDSIALPLEVHQRVIDHAHARGVDFITTPVSPRIVTILEELSGIDQYKLASMDIENHGLIHALAATTKPVIISTGMSGISEIDSTVHLLGSREITVLHCVSDYPLDPKNAALGNIRILRERFPSRSIGFSDHSLGHELAVAAVAMGARVIEKHVTLDRQDPKLAEHHFALEPREFADLVGWVRATEASCNETMWMRSPLETVGRQKYRRSFHYISDLPVGHILQESDVAFIRPGEGADYRSLRSLVGRPLAKAVRAHAPCLDTDYVA